MEEILLLPRKFSLSLYQIDMKQSRDALLSLLIDKRLIFSAACPFFLCSLLWRINTFFVSKHDFPSFSFYEEFCYILSPNKSCCFFRNLWSSIKCISCDPSVILPLEHMQQPQQELFSFSICTDSFYQKGVKRGLCRQWEKPNAAHC